MSEIRVDTISEKTSGSGTTVSNLVNPENPFRNIIINGDMSIAQRATSSTGITADGYYTVDRFNLGIGSFGTWTQSQVADSPAGYGLTKALKMDCTTAQGSPGSSALITFDYAIEGQHLQRGMAGTANAQKICLTFFHKHTKTGINTVELLDADNNDAVSGSYTQSVSNTWEKATIIFPAKTSGAFGDDNNRSLRVRICLGAGTDLTSGTLATTWQSSITNANRHAGQVNNADSTSNNFIITGVQLEFGEIPTDFEHLPRDVNLQRCYRYTQRHPAIDPTSGSGFCIIGNGYNNSSTVNLSVVNHYVPMRADVSLTNSGSFRVHHVNAAAATSAATTLDDNTSCSNSSLLVATVGSGLTAGQGSSLEQNNDTDAHIILSAEL